MDSRDCETSNFAKEIVSSVYLPVTSVTVKLEYFRNLVNMDFPDCRWRSDYCPVFHEPGRALRHIPAVGQQSRQQKGRHGLS